MEEAGAGGQVGGGRVAERSAVVGAAVGAVLIADLTGFGRLTEAEGDEAAAEVAVRFAALVREALGPGEQLVKTLGDGVLVVSPDLGTARATAARIRHRVAADGSLPPVHAGLRGGTVVWREGDVFGAAVNDAARLAEAAGPWEIAEASPPRGPVPGTCIRLV